MVLFNIIWANQSAAMAPSPQWISLACTVLLTTFPEEFTDLRRKKGKERKGFIEAMEVENFSLTFQTQKKGVEV